MQKIISGGQTGADRAALDVAIRHSFLHSGWCPKGRKAEDGAIEDYYHLTETPSGRYSQRTEWNARDSDGTAVFTLGAHLTGGSLRTVEFARKHGNPVIHISKAGGSQPVIDLQRFVEQHSITRLNVAGSRERIEPGIYLWVTKILEEAFFQIGGQPQHN